MSEATDHDKRLEKFWTLIKDAHSALLVTVAEDGSLDSRPMGCIQREFDGILWFFTFTSSPKIKEIANDSHVLVSYARPSDYEYVSLSGRACVIRDEQTVKELWSESFRVWFPSGREDPELALISVDVDEAKYWTDAASIATYAWAYVKARLLGRRPEAGEVADVGSVRP